MTWRGCILCISRLAMSLARIIAAPVRIRQRRICKNIRHQLESNQEFISISNFVRNIGTKYAHEKINSITNIENIRSTGISRANHHNC